MSRGKCLFVCHSRLSWVSRVVVVRGCGTWLRIGFRLRMNFDEARRPRETARVRGESVFQVPLRTARTNTDRESLAECERRPTHCWQLATGAENGEDFLCFFRHDDPPPAHTHPVHLPIPQKAIVCNKQTNKRQTKFSLSYDNVIFAS